MPKYKEHRRKWAKEKYWANRAIIEAAKDVPCALCGKRFPSVCMDFHHRNPEEKLFDVSQCKTRKTESILEEIEKCDVYCANCHRIIEHGG